MKCPSSTARKWSRSVVIGSTFVLGACGGAAPERPLEELLLTLSEPTASPAMMTPVLLALLDASSRAAVDQRADALSRQLGIQIRPDEVIRVDGLSASARFTQLDLQSTGSVKVSFGRAGLAEGIMPEPVVWNVVEEGQGLKLSLGELPSLPSSGVAP